MRFVLIFLVLLLILSGILFAFLFLSKPSYSGFQNQLAAVLKVEARAVKEWSQKSGIQNNLKYGDQGRDVLLLQYVLKAHEDLYPSGELTGFFGTKTESALRAFQEYYHLPVSGRLDSETRSKVNSFYFEELCPLPESVFPDLVLSQVGKDSPLPGGYRPHDLVSLSQRVKVLGVACLRHEAAGHIEEMFADARKEGYILAVTSAFRLAEIQDILFNFWSRLYGQSALDFIAPPGFSEHQLGTTVDLTARSINYQGVSLLFGSSPEGKWLEENSWRYGFVMSYPQGKEKVTGFQYEPWHFRYVGQPHAQKIFEQGITLREHLGGLSK